MQAIPGIRDLAITMWCEGGSARRACRVAWPPVRGQLDAGLGEDVHER